MSAGDVRVFVYPPGQGARVVFVLALALGFISVLLVTTPVGEAVVGLFILGLLVAVTIPAFLRSRPIAVTEERIDLLLCGWSWRTFYWRDVDRIEKPELVGPMKVMQLD